MKLNRKYLNKCYHDAMILQYKDELRKEGFITESEREFSFEGKRFEVDLYAKKGEEKRIYEFKLIGKKEYQKGQITKFKELAKIINAKPFVVYVNPPIEKEISFDDLVGIINDYFINEEIPSQLDELSTHTSIDCVEVDEILSLVIEKLLITVTGLATINVNLQYGSNHDCDCGDGDECNDSFPLAFTIKLDHEYNIENIEYEIDTSEWYGE